MIAALGRVAAVAHSQDMESLSLSAGRFRTTTYLIGMTPTYSRLYNQSAARGRLIDATDVSFGRSGLVTQEKLCPGQDAIGKSVRVGSHEFEVVGGSRPARARAAARTSTTGSSYRYRS